jgi:hypothetical protein
MDSHAVGLESPTIYPVQVRVAPHSGNATGSPSPSASSSLSHT